jgi:error-prone DNA polymerase
MGFNNPSVPWSDLERTLSGRRTAVPAGANGGDSPAWSSHRPAYEPPERIERPRGAVPYAELHCHSNFSFLDGASHPEELVEEAVRLGLEALALTDHDGFYGVVRFAEAASALGLPTIFGSELTLQDRNWRASPRHARESAPISPSGSPPIPQPDPPGTHLLVLARDPVGYGRLARAISRAQMAGEKGAPRITLDELADLAGTASGGGSRWIVLTGCRKGAVPAALEADGPAVAARRLAELVERFGREAVAVELWDHGGPLDSARNDALADIAIRAGVDLVATNNVHYGHPSRRPLATALAAVRARRSLDEMEGWLPVGAGAHLRS